MTNSGERDVKSLFDRILGRAESKSGFAARPVSEPRIQSTKIQSSAARSSTLLHEPEPEYNILDNCVQRERFNFVLAPADMRRTQVPEEYRILKTNVQAMCEKKKMKSFVISSCHHSEGKTTTAVFLAAALGKDRHKKVLLVDGDMRRPRIRKFLGLQTTYGLEDIIEGSVQPEKAIIYSRQDNFAVLPSRKGHSNATELIERPRTRALPDELERHFDYVIYDSPPVLSTTDPAVLGAFAGGVLLVVKAGTTQREAIQYARSLLSQADCEFHGIVLTQRREYLPRYFQRYRYYYDYGYSTYGPTDESDGD